MFKKILIPVDNSNYSNRCIDIGICIAQKFAASLVGSHVFAARLHDDRFKQMENGLPQKYQQEKELERQRKIHDSLITRGLTLISDSYLDTFEKRCRQIDVPFERKLIEGKNFDRIVMDVKENPYDLVIIGALGLGAVSSSCIGSVCERVVRKIRTNVLVVKEQESETETQPLENFLVGKICVTLDGSPESLFGFNIALALAKAFDIEVEAVSAFDPNFHNVAFKGLVGVLSEEAGKVFKFSEQEKLHSEVIDKGLAKIYQSHLDQASSIGAEVGLEIKTTLLAGKPFDQILQHINTERPSLLIVGRFGIHRVNGLEIGSTAENLLRLAPCNILIVNGKNDGDNTLSPRRKIVKSEKKRLPEPPEWTKDAQQRLAEVPSIPRMMTKNSIENFAREKGYNKITPEVMEERYKFWGQGSKKSIAKLKWTEEAKLRMQKIPVFIRGMVIKEIENHARKKELQEITSEIVDEVKGKWAAGSPFHSDKRRNT
jgi:nucleotide-binding universal stress UspA family protein